MNALIGRHGITPDNECGKYQGSGIDAPLSDAGRQQAWRLAHRLAGWHIDAIYASPLSRAVQTAEPIARCHPHCRPIIDAGLRERCLGIYEGQTIITSSLPRDQATSGKSYAEFCPSGGESFLQTQVRMVKAFLEIVGQHHDGQTIFIASHGAAIVMLLLWLKGLPITKENYQAYRHKNCGLTKIRYRSLGDVRLEFLNCTAHLMEHV